MGGRAGQGGSGQWAAILGPASCSSYGGINSAATGRRNGCTGREGTGWRPGWRGAARGINPPGLMSLCRMRWEWHCARVCSTLRMYPATCKEAGARAHTQHRNPEEAAARVEERQRQLRRAQLPTYRVCYARVAAVEAAAAAAAVALAATRQLGRKRPTAVHQAQQAGGQAGKQVGSQAGGVQHCAPSSLCRGDAPAREPAPLHCRPAAHRRMCDQGKRAIRHLRPQGAAAAAAAAAEAASSGGTCMVA